MDEYAFKIKVDMLRDDVLKMISQRNFNHSEAISCATEIMHRVIHQMGGNITDKMTDDYLSKALKGVGIIRNLNL